MEGTEVRRFLGICPLVLGCAYSSSWFFVQSSKHAERHTEALHIFEEFNLFIQSMRQQRIKKKTQTPPTYAHGLKAPPAAEGCCCCAVAAFAAAAALAAAVASASGSSSKWFCYCSCFCCSNSCCCCSNCCSFPRCIFACGVSVWLPLGFRV